MYGPERLPVSSRQFVIQRPDSLSFSLSLWEMGEREKGRKEGRERELRVRSHAYFNYGRQFACHAKRMRGACGGFFKYPDNYVIVTRGRCKTLRRRFWKLIPEIHLVSVSDPFACEILRD